MGVLFMFLLYIILRVSAMIIVHYAEQNKSEILALDKHSRAYYNIVEQSLNYSSNNITEAVAFVKPKFRKIKSWPSSAKRVF